MGWRVAFRWAVVMAVVGFTVGCSRQPPGRFEISGSVTFAGKPVPVGQISFEPDSAKGNRGPQALARIENGRYRTQPMKGSVAGPVRITVTGYDGLRKGETPFGTALFKPFTTEQVLPAESNTLDIVVPTNAAD